MAKMETVRLFGQRKSAGLLLADGTYFPGFSFGYQEEGLGTGVLGEIVFHTAMSGYQEILTDPSYFGQIVVMTYPHIGNYGINAGDWESTRFYPSGLIVHDPSNLFSNQRALKSLPDSLIENKIPALGGIDTRALTRHIRDKGAMNAYLLYPAPKDKDALAKILLKLQSEPSFGNQDLVHKVSCKEAYWWKDAGDDLSHAWNTEYRKAPDQPVVAVIDMGAKHNMLRALSRRNCRVRVFPSRASVEEILACHPKGVLLSNGPGDPAFVQKTPETVARILGKVPVFGICMGHQILAQAIGAKTFKMKFGHHGANQPVLDISSGKVLITSQNHGYAIDPASLPANAKVSQINLNDQSVEGIELPEQKAFSVQYHPEACPGPRDAMFLFDRFMGLMGYE